MRSVTFGGMFVTASTLRECFRARRTRIAQMQSDLGQLAVALLEMPAAQCTSTLDLACRASCMKATAPSRCGSRLACSTSSSLICKRVNFSSSRCRKSGQSCRTSRLGRTVCIKAGRESQRPFPSSVLTMRLKMPPVLTTNCVTPICSTSNKACMPPKYSPAGHIVISAR